jgi:hypothetical protein
MSAPIREVALLNNDSERPLQQRIASLESENARVRADLSKVQTELALYRTGRSLLSKLLGWLAYGPGLTRAIADWEVAYQRSSSRFLLRKIPRAESLDVVAAYLRRRALSGLLIAVLAAFPATVTVVLLWQQNAKIDQQILLTASANANQLQSELTATTGALFGAGGNICLPGTEDFEQAVGSYFKSSNNRLVPARLQELQCWSQLTGRTDVERAAWLRLHTANPTTKAEHLILMLPKPGVEVNPAWIAALGRPLPPPEIQVQATILSDALRPYRALMDADQPNAPPKLAAAMSSPERGALLKAYAAAQLSTGAINLSHAWVPGQDLSGASLARSNLSNAFLQCATIRGSLEDADLSRARASGANFGNVDLRKVRSLAGADLRFAVFNGAFLPDAETLKSANLSGATFGGAIAPQDNWLLSATGASSAQQPPYKYTRVIDSSGLPTKFWVMENTSDFSPLQAAQAKYCEIQRMSSFVE